MSSLKQLVTTVVAIAETRLELLADELQVERQRIVQMIVLGAGALFFTACGILLLTLLVIVALWDSNRLLAIGAFALLYIALGCGLAVLARQTAAGSRLFAASLGELRKDRARLSA